MIQYSKLANGTSESKKEKTPIKYSEIANKKESKNVNKKESPKVEKTQPKKESVKPVSLPFQQTVTANSPTTSALEASKKIDVNKKLKDAFKEAPKMSKVDKAVTGIIGSALDTVTFGQTNRTMKKQVDKNADKYQKGAAGLVGTAIGSLVPIAGLESVSAKAVSKLAPKLSGIGKTAANAAMSSGLYSAASEGLGAATGENKSAGEIAKDIAVNTALGAGLGAGLGVIGKGLGKMRGDKAVELPKVKQPKQETIPLTNAINTKNAVRDAEKAIKKTERSIQSVNKSIEKNGKTDKLIARQNELKTQLGENKTNLTNAQREYSKINSNQLDVNNIEYTPDNVKSLVNVALKDLPVESLKDAKSGFAYSSNDIYRNLQRVFKDGYGTVKKTILDPFDNSKKQFANMQQDLTSQLKTDVVDKLGIKKGSKLSAAVQDFGEKNLSLDSLKSKYPKDWEKVVEADKWFRSKYDNLIDEINKARLEVYPNNPEKLVPKRQDYYRHFREMNDLVGLVNIFDTPSAIDPKLVGMSEFTQPKSKFAGFMQKRGLGKYKSDAVGGFLEYIPAASYAKHIDKHIQVFSRLKDEVVTRTENTKNLNNLINYLSKYSQDLAGKTNPFDRVIQDNIIGGRTTMGVLNWINNRTKKNQILGNTASALAQLGNVPNAIAATKLSAIPGAARTFGEILKPKNAVSNQSGFLAERFLGKSFRQFNTRWFEQPQRLAEWIMETADQVGTKFTWNSAYEKALAEGIENPIKYADDLTRELVAGRGVGEVPLLQKAKVVQIFAPFTLEVANAWRVQGKFVKNKDVTALMTLYLTSYMMNKAFEETRGSKVVYDPIKAIKDGIEKSQEDNASPLGYAGNIAGSLAGETLSNVPFGASLASVYPEYGVDGTKLPTRKELFGNYDPTRFGTQPLLTRGFTSPQNFAYSLLSPFGGNQIKKTIEGATTLARGGYEKDGKLRYLVDKTPTNVAKSLLFGSSATNEGKNFYNNTSGVPFGEKQTESIKSSDNPKEAYQAELTQRKINALKREATKVLKDKSLSQKQIDDKLNVIQEKYDKLTK